MPACPATPPRSRTSSLCWHTRCAAASCLALLLVASFTVSCTGDLHNNTSAIDAACRAQRFLYGAEGLSPKEKAKLQQEILDIIFAKGEPSASRPPSLTSHRRLCTASRKQSSSWCLLRCANASRASCSSDSAVRGELPELAGRSRSLRQLR